MTACDSIGTDSTHGTLQVVLQDL